MTHLSFGTVAPTSRRAVAYIIDALIAAGIGIVLSILLLVVAFAAGPDGMLGVISVGAGAIWLVLLGWFVFYTFMQAGNGSIGMRAQGLRLVREADGAPLGFGKALLRNIIFGLSAAIVVGYFTPLFDGSGRFQGWHDKVAGSLMLDARAGGAAMTAPATTAVPVPPRPPMPDGPAPSEPSTAPGAPPIPGLATPTHGAASYAPPAYAAPPASPAQPAADGSESLDHTVRAPGREDPAAPAPRQPDTAPQAPVLPQAPAFPQDPVLPQSPAAPQTPAPAPISHPAAPVAGEDALIAFVPGITQDGPPPRTAPTATEAAAAPEQSAPATDPAPTAEASGDISDIEDTRISIPGHRLIFTWDDGTKVTVSRRTLFGRNPAPEEGAAVVSVRDETLSLSKTHFEAAAEPSGGWIRDRHSTNGTVIMRDGHRIACPPGEQVRIRLGDAIEIGDRIVTVGGYA